MDENRLRWKNKEEVFIPPIGHPGFMSDIILREKVTVLPLSPKRKELRIPSEKKVVTEQKRAEEGSDLTVLLGSSAEEDGSGKTVLLQNSTIQIKAFLEREKTNEQIEIDKAVFVIGKERKKVDYQITGNPSVSRTHIRIEKRLDGYFMTDLDSSNHTYVEEEEIKEDFRLEHGMRILLADEYFVITIVCEK